MWCSLRWRYLNILQYIFRSSISSMKHILLATRSLSFLKQSFLGLEIFSWNKLKKWEYSLNNMMISRVLFENEESYKYVFICQSVLNEERSLYLIFQMGWMNRFLKYLMLWFLFLKNRRQQEIFSRLISVCLSLEEIRQSHSFVSEFNLFFCENYFYLNCLGVSDSRTPYPVIVRFEKWQVFFLFLEFR